MNRTLTNELNGIQDGQKVSLKGYVDTVRKLGGITFFNLRDRKGTVQVTLENTESTNYPPLKRHDIVSLEGLKRPEQRAPNGYEVVLSSIEVISSPEEQYPLSISPKSSEKIDTILAYRPISLRNPKTRDIFILQQAAAQSFRDYLRSQDFIEIFSPKIVSQSAEGGSNVFKLQYFEKEAFLAQSPQFYKQMMVGSGLERVFEIGHVYRAEPHDTARHLNEYVSMDIEMGFIDSFNDLMDLEENMLKYMFRNLTEKHSGIFKEFGVEPPIIGEKIPRVPLHEMKELITKEKKKNFKDVVDIDPEGERFSTEIVKSTYGSDLVFLTHYPMAVRPFYTMPNKNNPTLSDSFDLVYRGLEITTGGQRIHDYNQLLASMQKAGVSADEGYVSAFKYGMPPHGGMGIGLERLTAKLLGLSNVREASLFPRDRNRITP